MHIHPITRRTRVIRRAGQCAAAAATTATRIVRTRRCTPQHSAHHLVVALIFAVHLPKSAVVPQRMGQLLVEYQPFLVVVVANVAGKFERVE